MIKINLLGDSTAIDYSPHYFLAAFVATILFLSGLFYYLNDTISEQIAGLNSKSRNLQNELTRVQKITAEVRDLEARQAEYNRMLIVIAKLKKNKAGPVRVLDDLNRALPERAWLTEVKEQDGALRIAGRALDNQTVASFIRELEKSEYFGERSNEVLKQIDYEGVKIREFSFLTRIYYSGKTVARQAEQAQAEIEAVQPTKTPKKKRA